MKGMPMMHEDGHDYFSVESTLPRKPDRPPPGIWLIGDDKSENASKLKETIVKFMNEF